jgi:lipopolysaccharide/colanic/teichoic acid biosynthesis glycosyltransferase
MLRSGPNCDVERSQAPTYQAKSIDGEPLEYVGSGDAAATKTAPEPVSGRSANRIAIKRQVAKVCPCPRWKRSMDIVGGIAAVVMLWPLLLGVAALIRCVSRGPVFFRQRRFGAGGKSFILWKFRTMEISEAPARHRNHVSDLMATDQPLTKRDYELGLIPGGRLLRKLGLDELPQLFNVLKGEMSLVGPRPDVVPPRNYRAWQRRRFDVVPGMTGLWQVCGKNETTFSTMMLLDVLYVRRRNFWLDVIILLRTIPAIAKN